MAADDTLKITKEDILEKFLVTEKYGENPNNWPKKTIAACKITWPDKCDTVCNSSGSHAEHKVIEFLKTASKTKIEVYQNYSPCKECAKEICQYMNSTGDQAEMTITFANFYKTHPYGANSIEDAMAYVRGLKKLNKHDNVNLQLFGVHFKWERFLGMSQFFSLTEKDKNECLAKADSPSRKDRERQDQMVWDEIFSADEITSGLEELRLSEQ